MDNVVKQPLSIGMDELYIQSSTDISRNADFRIDNTGKTDVLEVTLKIPIKDINRLSFMSNTFTGKISKLTLENVLKRYSEFLCDVNDGPVVINFNTGKRVKMTSERIGEYFKQKLD